MSKCRICGLPAGFFANEHEACVKQQDAYFKEQEDEKVALASIKSGIIELASSLSRSGAEPQWFKERLQVLRAGSSIGEIEVKECLMAGIHRAVDDILENHLLTNEEAGRLFEVCSALGLVNSNSLPDSVQKRLVKALILSDISKNQLIPRLTVSHDLPIVLQKDEHKIWLFLDSDMYSYVTRTRYEGTTQGVSVRVANGLYLRFGKNQGERLQSEELRKIDSGFLLITSVNTYFKGALKTLKVPHSKLLSISRWDDAVELTKDGANPKPTIFSIDDPWFAHNLLNGLASQYR